MPAFPTKETNIAVLAYRMVAGYVDHLADFPHIGFGGLNMLLVAYSNYSTARDVQGQACAVVKLATDNKNASLGTLRELMKKCLKKSEVDVGSDSEKLEYIGWGPKAEPQPADPPAAPGNLTSLAEGPGTVILKWDSPIDSAPVRNYITEKRIYLEDKGRFGPWQIAGTSLDNEINLKNQPTGVQLEFRAKAINAGGESSPSNTIAVVL